MSERLLRPTTAFEGHRLLQSGALLDVALAVKTAVRRGSQEQILAFDDATGRVVDLDTRGTKAEIAERLAKPPQSRVDRHRAPSRASFAPTADEADQSKGRGRPKLGVIPREVTLLPRHWDWLARQPAGASATLRRLVDEARRRSGAQDDARAAREAAYHFMHAIAGDFPGYEEALRALFAEDRPKLDQQMATWPPDIRRHVLTLALGATKPPPSENNKKTQ